MKTTRNNSHVSVLCVCAEVSASPHSTHSLASPLVVLSFAEDSEDVQDSDF